MFDRARAKARYRVAKVLLVYGLVAIATSLPLFIWAWGSLLAGYLVLFYFASGWLALALATAFGIYNLMYLRRNPDTTDVSKVFE
jgi:hypothetical protein